VASRYLDCFLLTYLPTRDAPPPCGAQIVQLLLQPRQPQDLLGAREMEQRSLGQAQVVRGVPAAYQLQLGGYSELLPPELLDCRQHIEAWLPLGIPVAGRSRAQQMRLDQPSHALKHIHPG
jgi:hypothetical protein